VEYREVDTAPPVDNAPYVLIDVELCGICTPEQRVFRGTRAIYPYWGGHEVCGTVSAEGPVARPLRAGERVAVSLMPRRFVCGLCWGGRDNHCAYECARAEIANASQDYPGPKGFSTRLVAPPQQVFPVGPHTPPEHAALVEPLACVLRSIDAAQTEAGDDVVVVGAGTMGLLHALLLRQLGRHVTLCVGENESPPEAWAAGPSLTLAELADRRGLAADQLPRAVFCTRGGAKAIEAAFQSVARGGAVVLYQSIPSGDSDEIRLSANALHYREIRVVGSIAHTLHDFHRAAQWVGDLTKELDALRIIVAPAHDPLPAFERAIASTTHRVQLDFRSSL
jgi:L-iditol 2-dehydrogenase